MMGATETALALCCRATIVGGTLTANIDALMKLNGDATPCIVLQGTKNSHCKSSWGLHHRTCDSMDLAGMENQSSLGRDTLPLFQLISGAEIASRR
ncbi:hypothetical protein NEOLEDRAFT_1242664 [Neolentinus lepideus HHB14362 ss-1]|uniref:Uncharacterized protein n=1 Tax=Neolentinus lepideus HHB14362 ss-1 TaxID=1314782 RepID=A0A165RRX0_9AGAM|nr:hypothetical protein NEOLEDRAFT_1242664 [Neolentinus lepideus HHB14362 ss-1]